MLHFCCTAAKLPNSLLKGSKMATIAVHCPDCGSNAISKYGKTSDDKQRYHCENINCTRKTFILDYQQKARVSGVKEMIIDMTLNGSGIRDIARVLKVSTTTVIKEIKKSLSLTPDQSKGIGTNTIQDGGPFKMYKSC